MTKISTSVLLLFFLWYSNAEAQLKLVPLERKGVPATSLRSKSSARTKATEPLKLPFWDDFSFTPVNDPNDSLSNYPLDSLWENSWHVWINTGLGANAPSLNVATFDGLDSAGQAYSDQLLANGFRDNLTSRPIDLSDPAINRTTVYLSFFYQWKGNGEPPDAKDYLQVEFKNDSKAWENVMTIPFRDTLRHDAFYFAIVQVNGERFFHDNFQFQIRDYGRQSGPYDHWHIDYVYLNKNRNANDRYFPDGALASTIGGIFGPFTSIPIHHFRTSPIVTPATVDVFNFRGGGLVSYNYRAFGKFKNYIGKDIVTEHEETLVYSRGIGTNPDGSATGVIPSHGRVKIQLFKSPNPGNPSHFEPAADSTDVTLKFQLLSNDVVDTLGNPAADYTANYIPANFRLNDTLSTTFHLKNYYAYDDGSAEYAATLTQAGDQAAYFFEMVTQTEDTLEGFNIYIPPYSVQGSMTGDFYIFDEKDGLPDKVIATFSSKTIRRKEINEFQSMRILPAILVPPKFFVGWKAPVENLLRVGLDLNNDSGDKIFQNVKGKWEKADIRGSLMIRPVLGTGALINSTQKERNLTPAFPNPNYGEFFIQGKFDHLEVLSFTGQPVSYTKEWQENGSKITLQNAPAGLYILRIKQGNAVSAQKIMVR